VETSHTHEEMSCKTSERRKTGSRREREKREREVTGEKRE